MVIKNNKLLVVVIFDEGGAIFSAILKINFRMEFKSRVLKPQHINIKPYKLGYIVRQTSMNITLAVIKNKNGRLTCKSRPQINQARL